MIIGYKRTRENLNLTKPEILDRIKAEVEGSQSLGDSSEHQLNYFSVSLWLSKIISPDIDLNLFFEHRNYLKDSLVKLVNKRSQEGQIELSLKDKAKILKDVLHGKLGYEGKSIYVDEMESSYLHTTIEERKGTSICLGMIYLTAIELLGWSGSALRFPSYFLIRLEEGAQRVIIDPFDGGKTLEIQDLRFILKEYYSETAELEMSYFEPLSNEEVLIRYMGHLKYKMMRHKLYPQCLDVLKIMSLIEPQNTKLLRERGLIEAHIGDYPHAIHSLELFLSTDPSILKEFSNFDIMQTKEILKKIKRQMT